MMRRKKSSKAAPEPETIDNPYIDAQRVWQERYGSYLSQAYNWRLIAMLEAIALIACIVGLIVVSTQVKLVPYVVAIDKVGMAFGVRPADRAFPVDERVIRAELATWIDRARSVVYDRGVQKRYVDFVYALITPNSPAYGYMNSYYPQHDPFGRSNHELVGTQIDSMLPIAGSNNSWDIQWTETVHDLRGRTVGKPAQWEATLTIEFHSVSDEATILLNPIGLYINQITWTQKT